MAEVPPPLPVRELPHTTSCFVCGERNPLGLNLRFQTDGKVVSTTFTPTTAHIGFRGVTHGGILATVLDEIMVWACAVSTRRFSFCAELTTRFHHPAQPDAPLTVTSELLENRRNRVFEAKAEIRDADGQLIAEATGKYRPLMNAMTPGMLQDVVGDISWIEGIEANA